MESSLEQIQISLYVVGCTTYRHLSQEFGGIYRCLLGFRVSDAINSSRFILYFQVCEKGEATQEESVMVWIWVMFGQDFLFLVIYLLDHWQALSKKQRATFLCNIITMMIVVITAWTAIETTQRLELMQQQKKADSIRIHNSVVEQYEKETASKVLIPTNQKVENEIEISGLEVGTKLFFQYDGPITNKNGEIKNSH